MRYQLYFGNKRAAAAGGGSSGTGPYGAFQGISFRKRSNWGLSR